MKIGVAGLGLIGGSLALALRGAHEVTGFDSDERARAAAGSAGVRTVARVEELAPADAVIVATPLASVVPTLERLSSRSDGALLLDTGSLKGGVVEWAARAPAAARIVGGHPMAGSTASGFAAADPGLFRGRPFLLVPTERSDDRAMAIAGAIARDVGAVVTVCSAEAHDRAMARLIAAPLASAAALAAAAASEPLVGAAGPGFRDATRLADTALELAVDVLFGNARYTGEALDSVIEALEGIRDALGREDREYVRSLLGKARSVRAEIG